MRWQMGGHIVKWIFIQFVRNCLIIHVWLVTQYLLNYYTELLQINVELNKFMHRFHLRMYTFTLMWHAVLPVTESVKRREGIFLLSKIVFGWL